MIVRSKQGTSHSLIRSSSTVNKKKKNKRKNKKMKLSKHGRNFECNEKSKKA